MSDKFTEAGGESYVDRLDESKFELDSDNQYDEPRADEEFLEGLDADNRKNKYATNFFPDRVEIKVVDTPKFMNYTDVNLPEAAMIVGSKRGIGRHYSEGSVDSDEGLAKAHHIKHAYQEVVSEWATQFAKTLGNRGLGAESPKNKFGEPDG